MALIAKDAHRAVAPFTGTTTYEIPTTPPAITREIREALAGAPSGDPPSAENPFVTDSDTRLADAETAAKALRSLLFRKTNIFDEIRARKRAALGIRGSGPFGGIL